MKRSIITLILGPHEVPWRRTFLDLLLITAIALLLGVVIAVQNGNILMPLVVAGGILFVSVIIHRPAYGMVVFMACTCLFEQFAPDARIGIEPITLTLGKFFHANLGPAKVNGIEVFLLFMMVIWFIKSLANREFKTASYTIAIPALVFIAMMLFAFGWGMAQHGDFKVSLWEVRALFYLVIMYFVTPLLIRTDSDLHKIIWVFILTIGVYKGIQGTMVFFGPLAGDMGRVEFVLSHTASTLFVTIFTLFAALVMFGIERKMKIVLSCFVPFTLIAFVVNQRRACYVTLILSLIIVFILLPKERKIKVTRFLIPLVFILIMYTGAFWNSKGKVGMFVQQLRSIFEEGEENRSNMYREIEKMNLDATIRAYPMGVGFGRKYLVVVPMDDISFFPLWQYMSHNAIFWVWVKMGHIGFLVFWMFIGTAIMDTVATYRQSRDPFHKVICLVVVTSIVSQMVVSYVDLQLTFYRNMIYLGCQLGLVAVIRRLEQEKYGKWV